MVSNDNHLSVPFHLQTNPCLPRNRRIASKPQAVTSGTLASFYPEFWKVQIALAKIYVRETIKKLKLLG